MYVLGFGFAMMADELRGENDTEYGVEKKAIR
jgi:hypothetical protein